jgi:hypothetical protein
LNLVTIVIWIALFGLNITICYVCIILEIILAAKSLIYKIYHVNFSKCYFEK